MKTRFCLSYCWNNANQTFAELLAKSWDEAISLFRSRFPALDENGYCKDGPAFWIVSEVVSI